MEIVVYFTCAGCSQIHQRRIDGLSVITTKTIPQLILEKDAWPASWAMTRDAKGNEKVYCPECVAAGKMAPPQAPAGVIFRPDPNEPQRRRTW